MTLAEIISSVMGLGIVIMGMFQRMKAQERERNEKEKERLREEMRVKEAKDRENDIIHFKTETALLIEQARIDERSKFAVYRGD